MKIGPNSINLADLEASGAILGGILAGFKASWRHLRRVGGRLGAILGPSSGALAQFAQFSGKVAPMLPFAQFSTVTLAQLGQFPRYPGTNCSTFGRKCRTIYSKSCQFAGSVAELRFIVLLLLLTAVILLHRCISMGSI